jgi:hypothetical protein
VRGQFTRRRIRKDLYARSSETRRESSCPPDNDQSWKVQEIGCFCLGTKSNGAPAGIKGSRFTLSW